MKKYCSGSGFQTKVLSFIFFAIFCVALKASSQKMPDFNMKLANGSTFSSTSLSIKKPVLIIYFAPDCEHCQILMKNLFQKIKEFNNTEIIMATFESDESVKGFINQFKTNKYKNILVGREVPVFFFKTLYQLQHTPFTALFDKQHNLVISYKDYTPVDDLIKHLKALK